MNLFNLSQDSLSRILEFMEGSSFYLYTHLLLKYKNILDLNELKCYDYYKASELTKRSPIFKRSICSLYIDVDLDDKILKSLINLKSIYILSRPINKYIDPNVTELGPINKYIGPNVTELGVVDYAWYDFKKGFENIKVLKCINTGINNISPNIETLALEMCDLQLMNLNKGLKSLTLIKSKSLTDRVMTDISKLKRLEHLHIGPRFNLNFIPTCITSLHLQNSSAGSNNFTKLKKLKKLKLENWSCKNLRGVISKLTSIELLHCNGYTGQCINRFKNAKYIVIKHCKNFNPKNLKIGDDAFMSISDCENFNPTSIKIKNIDNLLIKNCLKFNGLN